MNTFNPFASLGFEKAKELLEKGEIKGHPISAKQEYHLRQIVGNIKIKPKVIEKKDVICDHPQEYRLVSMSGKQICRKCYKQVI